MDLIEKLTLENNKRITWDEYFIALSKLISLRSPSNKLKVGSVIVKDKRVISSGYNGFPSGMDHISIHKDGHEVNTIHAEINSITDAAKRGVSINNTDMYVTHFPCLNCAKSIIASGIKKIIYLNDYNNDEIAINMFTDANILVKKVFK